MIRYLEINKLQPHPKNPREHVGDVTGLAESIRQNGILQNLTVVPNDDDTYTVVIGHRRLAAAKQLGLTTIPCVVSADMDPATQASTMLLENMQRSDLTPYEEAQGFQACLDLGLTEDDLKKKTGFSKTTIKHRLKLLELDKKLFKKGVDKGATLQDYIDLEQIEDDAEKNRLLSLIGTSNYRYSLNDTINKQTLKKARDAFFEKISPYMEKVQTIPNGYGFYRYLCNTKDYEKFVIPEDILERKYIYRMYGGNSTEIYRERLESEETQAKILESEKEPTKEELAVEEIKKKVSAAYQTRLEFAKDIYRNFNVDLKKNIELYYAFRCLSGDLEGLGWGDDDKVLCDLTGKLIDDFKIENINELPSIAATKLLYKYIFAILYNKLDSEDDEITVCTYRYNDDFGTYDESNKEEITELYEFLESYGYQPSEEETAIMFGTHELYAKGE